MVWTVLRHISVQRTIKFCRTTLPEFTGGHTPFLLFNSCCNVSWVDHRERPGEHHRQKLYDRRDGDMWWPLFNWRYVSSRRERLSRVRRIRTLVLGSLKLLRQADLFYAFIGTTYHTATRDISTQSLTMERLYCSVMQFLRFLDRRRYRVVLACWNRVVCRLSAALFCG